MITVTDEMRACLAQPDGTVELRLKRAGVLSAESRRGVLRLRRAR